MKNRLFSEEDADFDIWGQINQKLEENGQTVNWLAEQVPQGKKTFNWYYSRKRIKTDMLWDISVILNHNFFVYCSEYVQKLLAKKEKKETE